MLENDNADASANDDLRSSLEAAFETPAEPVETNTPAPTEAAADDGRPRDERGRFAPKSTDEGVEAASPDAPKAQTTEQSAEAPTVKPPASWSKETHDYWHSLPPAIQNEVLKRERDYEKGLQAKAEKYKPYDEIEQVIAPYRDRFRAANVSEAQAIQRLFAAQAMLDANPIHGLTEIARSYGIDLSQLLQPQGEQQIPRVDPTIMQLQQNLQQLMADREAEKQAALQREIASFRQSVDGDLYEAVRADMAQLLTSGLAQSLEDAYHKAIRMNDEAFQQWNAKEAAKKQAEAQKQTQQVVAKAKAAGSSVKGAPNGAIAADGPKPTLREELESQLSNF